MKATEFKNGSLVRTVKGSHYIELSRTHTASYKMWFVSVYNPTTQIYILHQPHEKFGDAKKHYEGLCKNFPVMN